LLRLWKLTGEQNWMRHAVSILENMAGPMAQHPAAFPHLLCALDFYMGRTKEIAIIGNPGDEGTRRLLDEVFLTYMPNKVIACGTGEYPSLLREKSQVGGRPTAYVCENFTCKLPVTTPEDLASLLKDQSHSPI
jgi:uncharacterized protein YyaL (SSP411 family)